jgi:uncharacterized protein YbjT (DUF2867 family)
MILVTGATGTVGKALVPKLLERGDEVRVMVRDPRKLGRLRVEVRLALGDLIDLADPRVLRQALRGVETVINLAAAIRDHAGARVEEVNGLATGRLLRGAERAGARRFFFFSAIGATEFQRTRFFRSKALAERAVRESELETNVFAPSIIYDHNDPWVTIQRRLALLPAIPISGSGEARFQPIWAQDIADCVIGALGRNGDQRHELAGPEVLSYDQIARVVARASGRERPLVHVPLAFVRAGLNGLRHAVGDAAFATLEEAELMEVPMVSDRGAADVRGLGVEPRSMAEVLG